LHFVAVSCGSPISVIVVIGAAKAKSLLKRKKGERDGSKTQKGERAEWYRKAQTEKSQKPTADQFGERAFFSGAGYRRLGRMQQIIRIRSGTEGYFAAASPFDTHLLRVAA